MGKQDEEIQGTEKEFLNIFRTLCRTRSAWQVWADVVSAVACSLSNAADHTPARYEKREKEYSQCIERLGSVETVAKLFAVITMALERNPDQDFLGKLFMSLELGSHWKGQFFTPFSVCRCMADITVDSGEMKERISSQGYVSVSDPACGAGATLIAAASTMRIQGINFQNQVLFMGQDLDRVAALMCYIQLSLLGCPGYVAVADTLSNPVTGHPLMPEEKEGQEFWYTPFYFTEAWNCRRNIALVRALLGRKKEEHRTDPPVEEKKVRKRTGRFYFNFEEESGMETNQMMEKETVNAAASCQEEPSAKEPGIEDQGGDFQERARQKLEALLEKHKEPQEMKVLKYLLERCAEDAGLAEDVCQEHKTWERCMKYVLDLAWKAAKGKKSCMIDDPVVYEWAEDYFHKDDKEDAKKEQEKKRSEKRAVRPAGKGAAGKKAQQGRPQEAPHKAPAPPRDPWQTKQKKKTNKNEMSGQISLFDL